MAVFNQLSLHQILKSHIPVHHNGIDSNNRMTVIDLAFAPLVLNDALITKNLFSFLLKFTPKAKPQKSVFFLGTFKFSTW